jgi:DNA polymerase-3 subunit chi
LTRVFFYHNATDRIVAAAALIGKAVNQKKALLVYAPDAEVAAALDRELWISPPTGFIPHVDASSKLVGETPVVITGSLDSPTQEERLFNLATEVPPGFSRFASLIEVIGQGDEERQSARQRARFYKDRGYEITYCDLAGRS